jgi:archaellum component FlaC
MAVLFLRQISILKQPNKINYSPLMIGIGAISSIVHFIIQPQVQDFVLLLRQAAFPLLVALLLYMVMNILHQTQETESAKEQDEFTKVLVAQLGELKEFMGELEGRIILSQQEDRNSQDEVRIKFREDIKSLDAIKVNQARFLEKFESMENWHKNVSKEFEQFVNVKMPSLDEVVHRHIDVLRVAELDHYNKLRAVLEKAVENRHDISEDLEKLKVAIGSIKNVSDDIAKTIIRHTLQQLSGATKEFETQIVSLKSHAEGIKTSLHEGENKLSTIRQQSEMIMKQMLLSSNKMNEIETQNHGLHNIYSTMKELMRDIETIKADYVKSQSQLSVISNELKSSEGEHIIAMRHQIDALSVSLTQKMDDSLAKLHEHYHIAEDDISKSVQFLAKRSQIQKGYTQS